MLNPDTTKKWNTKREAEDWSVDTGKANNLNTSIGIDEFWDKNLQIQRFIECTKNIKQLFQALFQSSGSW